jgi:hypothetical protein
MPGESIRITGLRSTVRNLKKFDSDLVVEIKRINREGAAVVAAAAAALVPVKSGKLRRSIRPGATTYTGTVRAGGANLPYTKPIHFGWPRHNIRPQPFLYEALDARRGEVLLAYERGIAKLCEQANIGGDE